MINHTAYQGRLTADPELAKTQSGVSRLDFTIAWSDKYKEIETKCFLQCKAWRSTAEFIGKYFRKGQEIVVEGKLNTEEWENNEGKKQSRIILSVESAHFCGPRQNGPTANTGPNQGTYPPAKTGSSLDIPASDDDLPF